MREAALHYQEMFGWCIVPCIPHDKKPSIRDWNKNPLTSYEEVDIHYQQCENDNIGVHPKKSNLLVMDFDNHKDELITTGPFKGTSRDGIKSMRMMLKTDSWIPRP